MNYNQSGIDATSAVGVFSAGASPYGCEDMNGNVWEWCATKWRDSYAEYVDDGGPDGGNDVRRVVRGGAFGYDVNYARCAVRGRDGPNRSFSYQGFRVVVRSHSS